MCHVGQGFSPARAAPFALAFSLAFAGSPAHAQVRPLVTEDAAPLGAGEMRLAIGGTWQPGHEEPVYGLEGDLLHLPAAEFGYGLGGVAELQVSAGLRTIWISERQDAPLSSILDIPGDRSSAPQDIVVATKIRLVRGRGRRPALGVRLATKLPNAGNESGLGSDMTDFSLAVLATWRGSRWTASANLGTAIVADPSQLGVQHDPTLYGVSLSRRVSDRTEVVGEVAGRWLPAHPHRPGAEDRSQVRAGLRRRVGRMSIDAALVAGLTSIDARLGVTGGATWTLGSPRTP
jgi:Putative MetA-pathway of phenol degradation